MKSAVWWRIIVALALALAAPNVASGQLATTTAPAGSPSPPPENHAVALGKPGDLPAEVRSGVACGDPSKDGAALMTGDHNLRVSLNAGTTTIKVTSSGKVTIEGSDDITVQSSAGITVSAQNDLTLQGQDVSISAQGSVSISANADVTVAGNPIKLN